MFIPTTTQRIVPGVGSKDAKICIIGEAPGAEDDRLLKPFVGPAGSVLESCMHSAGIIRSDCYITNTIKVRPKGNDILPYFNSKSGTFTEAGRYWVDTLARELETVKANIIVPLGACALAAVTGRHKIKKYRGYVLEALPMFGKRKVIPAYHPAATLRGQYILRYYIVADLDKAKKESVYPEIKRPERRIVIPTSMSEVREWTAWLIDTPAWACDIEVVNFQVSAIGFSPSPDISISFPMYHEHWTEEDEVEVWQLLNKLLTNNAVKVFQNGIFDINFLATQCGIHVTPPIEDTMIAHSIMYPELLKGLEFLVSMYCGSQEYYKDMVKWDNIKEEA